MSKLYRVEEAALSFAETACRIKYFKLIFKEINQDNDDDTTRFRNEAYATVSL